ncbi:ABC transporter permease [Paenibacillus rigui]|uniref:ABC transporter permease n=1 Tax=Paenibacillus rigui TaxID=554312 RepID=A0A229UIV3_9BACL|nr:ABC transporter permease subunit [Paenibacillus rigui]OXM83303.1 ABC transporter permease [Paenibacillus rigui]
MTTIIGMTWKELLRKRVLLLTLFMTLVFLLAFWFVAQTLGERLNRLGAADRNSISYLMETYQIGAVTLSLGFFFGSFVIAFLSIFSSFSVIAGEAEQGVLQALLPRPIARWQWYLGRWVGYVGFGVSYAAFLFTAILLITKYHSGMSLDAVSLMKSFALFAFVVPMLVSMTMLGSCIFSAIGNGVFMTMLFGAGWLGGMIEKVTSAMPAEQSTTLKPLHLIAGLMSLAMPADSIQQRMLAEMFSLSDIQSLVNLNNIAGPLGLGQVPSNAFLVYASCYTLAALAAGLVLFRKKDF